MKKNHFRTMGLVGCAAVMIAAVSVRADDLATASDKLAEISAMVVDAKFKLAEAANSGDVTAAAEAAKQGKGADSLMAQAMKAFSDMERALLAGDLDAAESAFKDLQKVRKQVVAIGGGKPAPKGKPGKPGKVVKGKPEKDDKSPNPNDVPWLSEELRDLLQELFDTEKDAGGSGLDGPDATEV